MTNIIPERCLLLVVQGLEDYEELSPAEFIDQLEADGVPLKGARFYKDIEAAHFASEIADIGRDTVGPVFTYYRLETDKEFAERVNGHIKVQEEKCERAHLAFLKAKYEGYQNGCTP